MEYKDPSNVNLENLLLFNAVVCSRFDGTRATATSPQYNISGSRRKWQRDISDSGRKGRIGRASRSMVERHITAHKKRRWCLGNHRQLDSRRCLGISFSSRRFVDDRSWKHFDQTDAISSHKYLAHSWQATARARLSRRSPWYHSSAHLPFQIVESAPRIGCLHATKLQREIRRQVSDPLSAAWIR